MFNIIKYYFELIKPGIIIANIFSVLSGFFFAYRVYFHIKILFYVLCATSLIIASGCVFNNIIDIDIDQKMLRTKGRVLARSVLDLTYVKIYGVLLFLTGCSIFLLKLNLLSFLVCIFGFFIYVIVYSLYMKRISPYAILVGSISGAIPPVVGYCVVSNNIDFKVILLFITFICWQIPHSYSILIIYCNEYKNANIPTFVIKNGILKTIKLIIVYIIMILVLILLFYICNFINMISFITLYILIVIWLCVSIFYYWFIDYNYCARLLFLFSVIFVFLFNILLIICSF